jgi:diadenosine tetraphosphate (Ap4A) HIT family hydrolase
MPEKCPFCEPDEDRVWLENSVGLVLWDAFPVTRGHTLVVPRRHVDSIYELTADEQSAMWGLVADARQRLTADLHPDGFNIGVNDGPEAGQTVTHAHVHVIPRYQGDVTDPRGGIRWVLPDKARYW